MKLSSWRLPVHSLSGRLVLLFVVMSVLFIIVLSFSLRTAFRGNFQENIRPHLERYLQYIQEDIGTPPDLDKARELARTLPVEIYIDGPAGFWSSDGQSLNLDNIHYFRHLNADGVRYAWGHDDQRDFLVSRTDDYTVAFALQHPRRWNRYGILPVLAALLFIVLLYYATRRLFSPIQDIRRGIEQIGAGQLDYRLDINRRDELGTLANSINAMADDIQHMLEAKRQLLLAISHELRSPLTRAKVALELIEDPQQRDEVNRDLNEMESLIEEILETERLSSRHSMLNKTSVSLNAVIKEVCDGINEADGVSLSLPEHNVIATIDVPRIRLCLKNLLHNALRHTPEGNTPPCLMLQHDNKQIEISVQDFGTGIEAEHLPHLTEPFYRVDSARRRETGGYGLGLYLCRVIIEAHGGSLTISSEPGKGTLVNLHLPLEQPH